jgi:hypothetical protein
MRGHVSRRGDVGRELRAALADKPSVSREVRHLFYDVLLEMNAYPRRISKLCTPIAGRDGLFAFDCLVTGMGDRAARPWAAVTMTRPPLLVLHIRAEFTGGRAERESAEGEAIARFDLE